MIIDTPISHDLDPELQSWLYTVETDIIAYGLDVGDLEHDCYIAARCELMNDRPDMKYVKVMLNEALKARCEVSH